MSMTADYSDTTHRTKSGPGLIQDLLDELAAAWRLPGRRPRVEDYVARLPDPGASEAVELIYQDHLLAEIAGLAPIPDDYLRRFPGFADRLAHLFQLHDAVDDDQLRAWVGEPRMPEAGDRIGPYSLIVELGRGGFARVFLASQSDLSDRLVVLKVSDRVSGEPQLLARVRHPHIVEVIRQGEADGGALHLVSMPYQGGASLSAVLDEVGRTTRRPRSGSAILEALDRAAGPFAALHALKDGPYRERISSESYPRAVAWLVARLAEALEHAHRRGVAHGDIKPSNILIASDGRPLLLDFNLAIDWRDEFEASRIGGGTLGYLAPERLRALFDPAIARRPRPSDRQRADLYAMGLVLLEALTGSAPIVPDAKVIGRKAAAERMACAREALDPARLTALGAIPVGLRPILGRLLAPDPLDRYPEARYLAEDLESWLAGFQTIHATSSSVPERARGLWRRRSRLIVAVGLVALGLGTAGVWGIVARESARKASAVAKLDSAWGGGDPDVFRFLPKFGAGSRESLDDISASARYLAAYGLDPSGSGSIEGDWRDRPDVRSLPASDRFDLELWLLEHSWRYAYTLSMRESDLDAWRRAVKALDLDPIWSRLGPFRALRAELRNAIRDGGGPPVPPPPSTGTTPDPLLERFSLGLFHEIDRPATALVHDRAILAERPESFWATYRSAVYNARLRRYRDAVDALQTCDRMRPGNPAILTQLANCQYRLGNFSEALNLCNQALAIDPDFQEAYRTRWYIDIRLGNGRALRHDAQRFASLEGRLAGLALWEFQTQQRIVVLSGGLPGDDPPEPSPSTSTPALNDAEFLVLKGLGLEMEGSLEAALRAYGEAIQADPDHLFVRLRHAELARQLGRSDYLEEFKELVRHPRFEELVALDENALRAIHVLSEAATAEERVSEGIERARRALEIAARRGLQLGESHYRLASALVPLAKTDATAFQEVVAELTAAYECHISYIEDWFVNDPRFDPIRDRLEASLEDWIDPADSR